MRLLVAVPCFVASSGCSKSHDRAEAEPEAEPAPPQPHSATEPSRPPGAVETEQPAPPTPAETAPLSQPNPDETTEKSAPALPAPVSFSTQRQLFTVALELSLTAGADNAKIRYTLDGSMPSASHGEDYTEPLRIETTTTVTAIAFPDPPGRLHRFLDLPKCKTAQAGCLHTR